MTLDVNTIIKLLFYYCFYYYYILLLSLSLLYYIKEYCQSDMKDWLGYAI